MLEPVTKLGRYRLGDQIGAGGMAEVFRAELSGAEGFSRTVAIKRVRARLVGDSDTARGFIEEARLAQRLQHGNIVQTYDLGIEAGVPYIVMELVDGMSLAEVISHNKKWGHRLGIETVLYVIEAVASALDYAHRLSDSEGSPDGVVHRDVNPRNILLSSDGIVKLTDFGIAKGMNMKPRTLPGRVKGTLGYLSPEQAYGGIIGPPTDQFATGVVLYQLLAGRNPLAGAKKIREYRKMLDEGLPRLEAPDVDDELRSIVHRATASKFDARFASMSEFRQTLEAWRVARGVRTSLDGVRDIVRSYRGHKAPPRGAVAKLDNALLAQLGAEPKARRDTRMLPSAEASQPRTETPSRRWIALLAAVLALAVLVVVVVLSSRGGAEPEATAKVSSDAADETSNKVSTSERLRAAQEKIEAASARATEAAERATEVASRVGDDIASLSAAVDDDELDGETGEESTSSRPRASEDSAKRAEKANREKAAAEDAAQKKQTAAAAAREKAAREKAAREKAAREKVADAKAAREKAAREKAAREKAAREKAAREKAAREKAELGTIRVNVLPYAEVSIDGKKRGRTPRTLRVSAGPHRIRLHNPDTGKTTTKTVTVSSGETTSITSW